MRAFIEPRGTNERNQETQETQERLLPRRRALFPPNQEYKETQYSDKNLDMSGGITEPSTILQAPVAFIA